MIPINFLYRPYSLENNFINNNNNGTSDRDLHLIHCLNGNHTLAPILADAQLGIDYLPQVS